MKRNEKCLQAELLPLFFDHSFDIDVFPHGQIERH